MCTHLCTHLAVRDSIASREAQKSGAVYEVGWDS